MFLSAVFVMVVDWNRFGTYIKDIQNDYLKGINNYSLPLNNEYKVIISWKSKNY